MTIFNDTKYTRWYYGIIQARRAKPVAEGVYSESHHIIPESFYTERTREGPAGWLPGNPEAADNKVTLTGREHGLCHWLLTKMTEGVAQIKCRAAFDMMGVVSENQGRTMTRMICRAYERNRIAVALDRSERMSENNPMDDPVARAKVGDSKRGKKRGPQSKEWLDKLTASRQGDKNGMSGRTHRVESRKLQSAKASLRTYSDETNDLRRTASSGRKEITDGVIYRKVKVDELQTWLDGGWIVKGKPRQKKKQPT